MKRFQKTSFLLAAACMCTGAFAAVSEPAAVYAAEEQVLDGMKYAEAGGEITITGYTKALPKELVIPAEIGGKPVTQIGEYAFSDAKITSVQIPEGIRIIGKYAFCLCTGFTGSPTSIRIKT